jgi:hypothetical protein
MKEPKLKGLHDQRAMERLAKPVRPREQPARKFPRLALHPPLSWQQSMVALPWP